MRIIKSIAFLGALSVLFSAVSCGNKIVVTSQTEQTEISFSWWGNDERHDYTLQAIEEFERQHPDIKVRCHYSEWSGYQTRNTVRMVSHTESDIMQINYAWISQYSPDGNNYYDINLLRDYIDLSNFTEDDLQYGMKNGKLNAIPIALNTMTFYANETVYKDFGLEIPKTWSELYKSAEVMKGKCYPISMSKKSAWFYIISCVGQQTGRDFMDENGHIIFTADDMRLMIETYCDMVNKNVIPPVEDFDKLNIASGKYAGVLAWVSDAESYCNGAVENGYNMTVADYTTIDGTLNCWYAKPATMYAIRKDIENPEAAAEFLDYLLNSEEMAGYQKIEKGTPLSSSARKYLEDNDMLGGIQYEAFMKMSDSKEELSVISPYFENDDMIDIFFDSCNEMLYGKSDSVALADELYSKMCSLAE
ncbi:MAG: ABC transporter substrate-binding protein [Ruminococcus sp.]|nr:ABC transporter substrate-binding protein [Ruminococcus sp.]